VGDEWSLKRNRRTRHKWEALNHSTEAAGGKARFLRR